MSHKQWFAINVRSNHETVVESMLEHKGYEVFVPMYRHRRKWSDRVRESSTPLFPGYVFCHFDPSVRTAPVVTTPGVIRIVGFGSTPVAVDDAEIDAIRRAVASGLEISPCPQFQPGSAVHITSGALAGVKGTVIRIKNQDELILSISLLQRSVIVQVGAQVCEKERAA